MKSTPARVAGSILTKSMRVRTLSLSRTKSFLHTCIRGRVGLSSTMSHEGVGFKPQSLRRRGFEPHRMHTDRCQIPVLLESIQGQCRRYNHAQVLPLHGQDRLARRQARRLRLRDQGHGRRQGRRGGRHLLGQDHQAGRHRRLRPALLIDEPVIDERFNVSMNAGFKKQPPGRGSTELAIGLLNIITRSS